ncbi:transporter substrate-binding domain-containing protein, partial [Bacteroides sp. 51]|uniref:transporter substrate-binding domain-containing protein n=1 Tax=Bacteroides sp. 51 TaxID=2302938 RepID=UPI0013D37E4D
YTGMAIDLWKMLEQELNFVTEYVEYNSLENLQKGIQLEEIDVAVTNLTITYERAQVMKFSFPWYDGGLRIMVRDDEKGLLWDEMKDNGQLQSYLWIALILLILTVLTTIVFRRKDPEFPKKWKEGFSLSLYNLMSVINNGSIDDKVFGWFGWFGHILATIWMVFGIGMIAYVTSTITSSMTKVSLTSDVNTLSDLSGKIIGVEAGGVEEKFLANIGIQTIAYDNVLLSADGLANKEVHAIVGDAPVLEYYVHTNRERKMKVVGNIFHPDKYAFASSKNHSIWMDSISVALIKLYDMGKIKELKDEYLGAIYE